MYQAKPSGQMMGLGHGWLVVETGAGATTLEAVARTSTGLAIEF